MSREHKNIKYQISLFIVEESEFHWTFDAFWKHERNRLRARWLHLKSVWMMRFFFQRKHGPPARRAQAARCAPQPAAWWKRRRSINDLQTASHPSSRHTDSHLSKHRASGWRESESGWIVFRDPRVTSFLFYCLCRFNILRTLPWLRA